MREPPFFNSLFQCKTLSVKHQILDETQVNLTNFLKKHRSIYVIPYKKQNMKNKHA